MTGRSLPCAGSGPRAQRAYREMCLCDKPQYTCLGFVDSEPVPMNGTPIRIDEQQLDAPDLRPGMRPELH